MLRIRLQRTGSKNDPAYRIVVAEKSSAAKGKFQEVLGHYLPSREPVTFQCDMDRVQHWISVGAVPTDTMARLFAKQGTKGMEKFTKRYVKRRSKKAPPEEAAAPAAPAAPAPEAPKEEGGDTPA